MVVFLDEYLIFLAPICLNSFCVWCTMYVFILTELNEVLDRLMQRSSQSPQRVETSDTSGDVTDTSKDTFKENFSHEKGVRAN